MKPNTSLIKYKDQPVVNLNNVATMYIEDPMLWGNEYTIDFEFVDGVSESWSFETREEAQAVYDKICQLFVNDLT